MSDPADGAAAAQHRQAASQPPVSEPDLYRNPVVSSDDKRSTEFATQRKASVSHAYRPDIDGLRAIAIIPVVLFHARVAGFGGGFVGVDVFFVISGFLITSLINKEIEDRVFSYLSFWERRARRLLPPMILVVAVTCALAYQFLFPEDLKALGQSVVAISGFASNFYFWLKSGYFQAPADTIPLLHTWSLAVEEQFYLLFPAVLVAVSASTRCRRIYVVGAIGIASFGLSVLWVNVSPTSAFYLLPSRAWELMLGAVLAISTNNLQLSRRATDSILLLGLSLIALPVTLYKSSTPFPGIAALVPCVGTALIIWANADDSSIVKRLLSNRFMVAVGQLSYSIYLWHWPLLVLLGAWYGKPLKSLTAQQVLLVMTVTVLASWLSLTFIENPIRRKRVLGKRYSIFLATGAGMALLAACGLAARLSHGFEARIPSDVLQIASGARDVGEWYKCRDKPLNEVNAEDLCKLGQDTNKPVLPTFVLWGDSHAHVLAPVVDQVAREMGVEGLLAVRVSCPPIPDLDLPGNEWAPDCQAFNNSVFDLISRENFAAVFIAARWSGYGGIGESRVEADSEDETASDSFFKRQMREMIERLTARGIIVLVFEEVPYPRDYSPSRFAREVWRGADPSTAGVTVAEYRKRNEWFFKFLDGIDNPLLKRISPVADLCRDGIFCPAVVDGRSNFFDENHISTHGAFLLTPAFRAAFRQIDWNDSRRVHATGAYPESGDEQAPHDTKKK